MSAFLEVKAQHRNGQNQPPAEEAEQEQEIEEKHTRVTICVHFHLQMNTVLGLLTGNVCEYYGISEKSSNFL